MQASTPHNPKTVMLDENGLFPLTLDYHAEHDRLTVCLPASVPASARFRDNLFHLLHVSAGDAVTKERIDNGCAFSHVPGRFTLSLGTEPLVRIRDGEIIHYRALGVSSTRALGTHHRSKVKILRTCHTDAAYDALSAQGAAAVSTDFHTHSSGQISAAGLLRVALQHDAYYPVHLLQDAGIETSYIASQHRCTQQRVPFPPLEPQDLPDAVECVALSALSDKDRETLARHMALPADRVSSFTDAEYDAYRMRYPLTKNTALLEDSTLEMAREALAKGFRYLEVSAVGLEKPEIFAAFHRAIFRIEESPEFSGFALRLKQGIPRSYSQEKFTAVLERSKTVLQSPYVVGVDLLGYENNKTELFREPLEKFARWLETDAPEKTLCIHAGENDKNARNLREALELAEKYSIRVRIGHGLYGLSRCRDIVRRILDKPLEDGTPRLHIECNPDSNFGLNNITRLTDMPLAQLLKHKIPFLAGSDSLGLYQTSARQIALSLIQAGFTAQDFDVMRGYQDRLEAHQRQKVDYEKEIGGWDTVGRAEMLDALCRRLKQAPPLPGDTRQAPQDDAICENLSRQKVAFVADIQRLPPELATKLPVAVVGASGTSWKRIAPEHQRAAAVVFDMLAHALDPEKVYFVQGRSKPRGVSACLNGALAAAGDKKHKPFSNVAMLADPSFSPKADYHHLSHMIRIKGQLDVADTISHFVAGHGGTLIAVGGAAYTRDIILKTDRLMEEKDKGLLYVMDGPKGASSEKAAVMDDAYLFREGKALLHALFKQHPEMFRKELRESGLGEHTLNALAQAAEKRVAKTYGAPAKHGNATEPEPPSGRVRSR